MGRGQHPPSYHIAFTGRQFTKRLNLEEHATPLVYKEIRKQICLFNFSFRFRFNIYLIFRIDGANAIAQYLLRSYYY